jgi:hypothetical protein
LSERRAKITLLAQNVAISPTIHRGRYMPKKPATDLVADLTWAELYARNIREHLKILSPVVKKIETGHELTESAALLRRQLENANRTTGELNKMIGVTPRRLN